MVVVGQDVECKIIASEVKKPDLITLDEGGDSTEPNSTSSEMQKKKLSCSQRRKRFRAHRLSLQKKSGNTFAN